MRVSGRCELRDATAELRKLRDLRFAGVRLGRFPCSCGAGLHLLALVRRRYAARSEPRHGPNTGPGWRSPLAIMDQASTSPMIEGLIR